MEPAAPFEQMEEGKKPPVRRFFRKKSKSTISDKADEEDYFDPNEEEDVYIVKQRHGYFSWLFSLAQTIILSVMMWQCGVAPLNINPMIGPYPDVSRMFDANYRILYDASFFVYFHQGAKRVGRKKCIFDN